MWLRRVFAGFGKFFELEGRLEDLERETERLHALVVAHELEWISQVDKLTAIHRRATKRIQDGTAVLAESLPTLTDLRASRQARKLALRARSGTNGSA